MAKIILATSSPYRQEAFRFLGLDFVAQASHIDECVDEISFSPKELVIHLAQLKAKAVSRNFDSGIVIGFDSIGWFDRRVLKKPKSRNEAFERLKSLSGKTYQFYTGVYMINIESRQNISKIAATNIQMRTLADSEINKYLDQDSGFNTTALGYDPLRHYSSAFIKKIEGSYNNVLRGIPLETIVEMLPEVGYEL